MSYQPTPADASSDLIRCLYASFSRNKFKDDNFKTFFAHALKIINKAKIENDILKLVDKRLQKAQDKNLDDYKRREDVLMAAILLQSSN